VAKAKGGGMKAKNLVTLLLKYPDFEVGFNNFRADDSPWGARLVQYSISGIADIGHSDKIIILDGKPKGE